MYIKRHKYDKILFLVLNLTILEKFGKLALDKILGILDI